MNAKPLYNLDGNIPSGDMDFFAPADISIGNVIYGYSSCIVGEEPPSSAKKLQTAIFGIGIGVLIGIVICYIIEQTESIDFIWYILICILTGGLGSFFGKARFHKVVCYIGTDGMQWMEAFHTRENVKIRRLFLFCNATKLEPEILNKYKDGIYNGSELSYKWFNGIKQVNYEWGPYFSDKNGIVSLKEYPAYYYIKRAEEMWNLHMASLKR